MKKIFETLKTNPLFQRISFSDFERMLGCMSAKTVFYKKDDVILLSGDTINFVGLILSGSVKIIKEDIDGRFSILTKFDVSEVFGEAFACAGISQSPVTIQAAEDSEILFIDYKKIITSCTNVCPFHSMFIENMLKLVALKNLMLNQKIEILSKRTTREKLMCYFDTERGAAKKFTIPFNREELARYLCVDRSAMSNELCKMRDEGQIKFNRNEFEITR
ncbi:MAG: Crp/Fnr family transcriptional regulator [Syntrophorhabdaceae bacterium]|nr:Crp/Fnr family transcriptional regulator [Syntrophorhabdaceae bacterium]